MILHLQKKDKIDRIWLLNDEGGHYDQSEPVPVMIFGGECRVDFEKIFESVSFIEDDEDYWLII